jgi:energy-coupling factor transporter transmembrane protein EcfT
MPNKKLFILIPILLAIVIFILFFFCFEYFKNNKLGGENINSINQGEEGSVNNNLSDEFDVNRIPEVQQVDESRESIINNPRFSIPKDVSGIEMMTLAEKESLGIDPNLEVQVLGRSEDGRPTGYQFIYSEEDFILDIK